ncbi:hypothetical protein [Streptomyces yaizuensis]|uniref:Uncharacterized protein n=1 Tax=Streptomyces yaizuensis TaxID=2989713 RepID=A0ABQ5P6I4_9ACTN|nr:hypothetical protein [Streptomyces sp. YSPA8]GLF98207.1 hypothetical protein SYYSPA8_27940 [Streptomyces sp. YSPA8]
MPQPPQATGPGYATRPDAPRWDVRLARSVLTQAGLADVDDDLVAPDGFSAGAERSDVLVWWTQDHSLAVPRRPESRRRWNAALGRIEAALDDAGFTVLRRTHTSVLARPPSRPRPTPSRGCAPPGHPQSSRTP